MSEPYYAAERVTLYHGDCLDIMRGLPSNSIDAIVTDPPAGIAFMGRAWDRDHGGRDHWIAWMSEIAAEALRLAKPGTHALVWALPRTSHWTATAWENAGWQVRDRVSHLFGSGFPKSLDVSKAIDRFNGDERPIHGSYKGASNISADGMRYITEQSGHATDAPITSAASAASAAWEGWGTALKPAMEDWWLLRKPLDGNVAHNVLTWGTGGLNIDGCRIGTDGGTAGAGAGAGAVVFADGLNGTFGEPVPGLGGLLTSH